MITVKDIYDFLNSLADFSTQESWDNSGMLVGNMGDEVKKIAVALDITPDVIEQAKAVGANLIVSHHPVIFSGQKSFTKGNPAYELAVNSINAICCHTPLDMASGGTNDVVAQMLGFKAEVRENPILRYVQIEETAPNELAKLVAEKLNAKVRFASAGKPVKNIAICTGSGCSLIEEAENIDAFITGDASHHDFIDCVTQGITLIAAGHFETEIPVVPVLAQKLKEKFTDIETVDLKQKNPIEYI